MSIDPVECQFIIYSKSLKTIKILWSVFSVARIRTKRTHYRDSQQRYKTTQFYFVCIIPSSSSSRERFMTSTPCLSFVRHRYRSPSRYYNVVNSTIFKCNSSVVTVMEMNYFSVPIWYLSVSDANNTPIDSTVYP